MTAEAVDQGRDAFRRRAWAQAVARLSAADRESLLEAEDLERLAVAAYLVGLDDDSADAGSRAHHAFLRRGDVARAVRCAFWVTTNLPRHRPPPRHVAERIASREPGTVMRRRRPPGPSPGRSARGRR